MEANILLSKIVTSPTDTTWSQAYSTLNLYVVLSIRSENPKDNIVTEGKDLLEKVQREYFSLDEKDLKNIKKSVENAVGDTSQQIEISLVLATVNNNIAYIVIANGGSAILKRGGKLGTVAKGEAGAAVAFSGELLPDDVVILETQDFSKKVPIQKLSETLDALSVSEISENLAPLIHDNPTGTEAAIVLQYKAVEGAARAETPKEKEEERMEEEREDKKESFLLTLVGKLKIPGLPFFTNYSFGRKKIIIISIVLLLILLMGSIMFERSRQESARRAELFSEIIAPAQRKFDEAQALASLNKGLAIEEFESIKTILDDNRDKFKQGSDERKKLDEFIGRVENKIGILSAGSTVSNQKVIFENVTFVNFRDEALVASDKDGKIFLLSTNGKSEKEIDSKNRNVKAIAANKTVVFLFGESGITRSTKSSGSTSTVVDDPEETASLDIFGANLYGLNIDEKTIDKYQGSSFTRADYLVEDVKLENPSSMTIDGSIWVIDEGRIRKFTRGKEDSFTISGLTGKLSSDSQIFTSIDYSNIYILDKTAAKIISISKDGEVKNQYVWPELSKSSSFTVGEEGKKVYVVIDSKLYSFSL